MSTQMPPFGSLYVYFMWIWLSVYFLDIFFDVNWGFYGRDTVIKITLVVVRVFILLSVCEFDADSAKSTVCESLSDNSFDEVCKDHETLLGSCTLSEWLMFFKTVVLDRVRLLDLVTLFTALFMPCSASAVLLTLILRLDIMVLSLEFIFFGGVPTSICHFLCLPVHPSSVVHHISGTVDHQIIIFGIHM